MVYLEVTWWEPKNWNSRSVCGGESKVHRCRSIHRVIFTRHQHKVLTKSSRCFIPPEVLHFLSGNQLAPFDDGMARDTLVVHNLRKTINGSVIISGLNFTVRAGEILFIRGPSGVGKTLLLRSLAYLDPVVRKFDVGTLIGMSACRNAHEQGSALHGEQAVQERQMQYGMAPSVMQDGDLRLSGRTPEQSGVPQWRASVTYVHQSRVQLKGTPSELYFAVQVECHCHICMPMCAVYACA